jgi:DNA polymerase-3 subunit delta
VADRPAVVLIDGDDPALVSEAVTGAVADLLGGADRSLSLELYAGEDVDLAAVADSCATPPMLSDRRIVVVREVGRWSSDEVAPLVRYLDDPLASTTLVLAAGGGQIPPKLAAAAKQLGRIQQTKVDSREADRWLRQRLGSSGMHFDEAAAAAVRSHLGEDLSRSIALVEVLAAAFGEGAELSEADVRPYLGQPGSVAPWTLTDAIDRGATAPALEAMHRLLEAGQRHPLVVLAVLHRHVQSLLKVDSPSIRNDAEAADALGITKGRSTFPAKKARDTSRRWGSARIAEAVGLLADAEVDLKGASAWPPEAVLEVLVARLCRLGGSTAAAGRRS